MRKITKKLNRAIAAITYRVASKGAEMASAWGWHQPKVPDKLGK